jgi:hypothetical protein
MTLPLGCTAGAPLGQRLWRGRSLLGGQCCRQLPHHPRLPRQLPGRHGGLRGRVRLGARAVQQDHGHGPNSPLDIKVTLTPPCINYFISDLVFLYTKYSLHVVSE